MWKQEETRKITWTIWNKLKQFRMSNIFLLTTHWKGQCKLVGASNWGAPSAKQHETASVRAGSRQWRSRLKFSAPWSRKALWTADYKWRKKGRAPRAPPRRPLWQVCVVYSNLKPSKTFQDQLKQFETPTTAQNYRKRSNTSINDPTQPGTAWHKRNHQKKNDRKQIEVAWKSQATESNLRQPEQQQQLETIP